jgi:hypothetical protein
VGIFIELGKTVEGPGLAWKNMSTATEFEVTFRCMHIQRTSQERAAVIKERPLHGLKIHCWEVGQWRLMQCCQEAMPDSQIASLRTGPVLLCSPGY